MLFVDERKQLKINVTPAAKDAVERFTADFDMTETGVASRVYEWFGRQPLAVQKLITGLADGSEGHSLSVFAGELAKSVAAAKRSAGSTLKRAAKPMPGKK